MPTKKMSRKEMFGIIGKVVKTYIEEDIEIIDKATGEVLRKDILIAFRKGGKGLFPRLDKAFREH